MKGFYARVRNRILSGVFVVIPAMITVYVLRVLYGFTAGLVLPVIYPAVDHWPAWVGIALSFVILVGSLWILGEITAHVVGRRFLGLGEKILLKVPVVRVIYRTSKQVVTAFEGQDRAAFKSVVFLEFPRQGMRALGFVTSTIEQPDGSTWNTVFVPTTPNPTTGFLQVVRTAEVTATDFSVEEAFKMIMSLGVLSPERVEALPLGS
ncbi:MAG TPA: DUF502 domain-containing protein [Longimicrobiales bacterium]|jgi:uncharacterized membrane protein